ncbi:GntR family transcriptional regulator [Clostridium sp. C105KSO13]|uniref:GntR family transcriptional regulator n=1 Tax=Clostridium sp. C105KSO13 TaxID=1776045 RepID=UPI00074069D3|nr:GntR family transcriptional regulator [Clostridium sp. C105KSO13]CUX40795.1 colanic acid/biofilm transcriptional regulator [Clostridium sp. C105KSO13]
MAEKHISLMDQAYEAIRTNILNLTYPPGSQLTEAKLTSDLNMSRSPVRAAVKLLQAEGLIVSGYYKSMTVKPITAKDVAEIYQLRELLESSAFRYIFITDRYEEFSYRIEEKVVRMCATANDIYQWELADTNMHLEIIHVFDNERINRIYENNMSELIRMGQNSVKHGMDIPQTNENLKRMVLYMRENNYNAAYAILRDDHFTTGKETALR